MSDKKISQLTAAAPLTGTEIVPLVQSGQTVSATAQDIADLGGGGTIPKRLTLRVRQANGNDNLDILVISNTTGYTFSGLTRTTAGGGTVILFNLVSTTPFLNGQYINILPTVVRDNSGVKSVASTTGLTGNGSFDTLTFFLYKLTDDSFSNFYSAGTPPGGYSPYTVLDFVFS